MNRIFFKTVLAALIILLSGTGLFGVGNREKIYKVGITLPDKTVEKWETAGNEMENKLVELGYEVELLYCENDQNRQNSQISQFISNSFDLIIVTNINTKVTPFITKAKESGIGIVAFDKIIMDSEDYNYLITYDKKKTGELQALKLVDGLDLKNRTEPVYITLLADSPTLSTSNIKYDAAMKILNPFIESGVVEIVGPYPRSSIDRMEFKMIARPGIDNLLPDDFLDYNIRGILAQDNVTADSVKNLLFSISGEDEMPIITGFEGETADETKKLANAAALLTDSILQADKSIPDSLTRTKYDTGKKMVNSYLLIPTKQSF